MRTAEPNFVEAEINIEKPKRYKLSGTVTIPAELIEAGDKALRSGCTYLFIIFGIRKNCYNNGRNLIILCEVIPWSSVLFESVIITQLLKKVVFVELECVLPSRTECWGNIWASYRGRTSRRRCRTFG